MKKKEFDFETFKTEAISKLRAGKGLIGEGGAFTPLLKSFMEEAFREAFKMRKKISKLGIDPNELGLFTRPNYKLAYEKGVSDNQ